MNGTTNSLNTLKIKCNAYNKEHKMKTIFHNAKIITSSRILDGDLLVADGKIENISIEKPIEEKADIKIDCNGKYLSPGFIDIHTHGAGGYDFMDGSLDDIYGATKAHMYHGTTSILPTSLTSTKQSLLDFIQLFNKVDMTRAGYPEIIGLHMEGPYFAFNQRGAQDPRYLRNPEPDEYNKVLRATNKIKRWSFAVELPGSEDFLRALREHGILSSVAHSDATCEEVIQAYENGVELITHFYSCLTTVKRVNAYRVAGAIEAGYLLDDMYVEIIADGSHLPKELLQLILKIKGPDHICLITDSMRAAGMPDGEYILGKKNEGITCIKEDNVAKLPDRSAFAGSVATTDMLVRNMVNLAGAQLIDAVKMASLTPAKLLGIADRKGSIAKGKDADLIVFDNNINIEAVMVRGVLTKNQFI